VQSVKYAGEDSLRAAGADLHSGRGQNGQPSLLGFDDHFPLLFGIWLAAEIPDALYLRWMIDRFAPKAALSSPFEYVMANLEGVVMHVVQLTTGEGMKVVGSTDSINLETIPELAYVTLEIVDNFLTEQRW
jgi:hypothetical protein